MNKLYNYLLTLIRLKFYGSVKISFEKGLPVSIKEEKSIDTKPFKEEIEKYSKEKNPD